ncbi:MAG: hypothetical protein SchgKO_09620 [Schleiferiaceae bacterium]
MKVSFSHILLLSLCFVFSHLGRSQSFTTSKDTAVLDKDLSFGTLHDYLELTNLGSSDLNLTWTYSVNGKLPSDWVVNWATPDSVYPSIVPGDSDGFVLKGDSTQKMVIGVTHNGEIGFAFLEFWIHNTQNQDSLLLVYSVNVTDPSVSLPEYSLEYTVISTSSGIRFASDGAVLKWYDLSGRLRYEGVENLEIPYGELGVITIEGGGKFLRKSWSTYR